MADLHSIQRVVSDGTLQAVDVTLDFFSREEVSVYIGNVLTTAWEWSDAVSSLIQFNNVIPSGTVINIVRATDVNSIKNNFEAGAAFSNRTLDMNFEQILRVAQEMRDGAITFNVTGDMDLNQYRITNMGDAVEDSDAVNKKQVQALVKPFVAETKAAKDAAVIAQGKSEVAAATAKASETSSGTSATTATQKAAEAAVSAQEAKDAAESAVAGQVNPDWNATSGKAQILNKPELSVVATSGHYDDLDGKPQNLVTDDDIAVLQEEIAKKGVPVGTVEYFATTTPPAGYLKADGAAVGRETYPDLFAAIGTTFGEGDGSSTFNLPDLIDRFAQGSNTPGQKLLAGLPNIDGEILQVGVQTNLNATGAFFDGVPSSGTYNGHNGNTTNRQLKFDASRSNPIYGASNTVQPPALTLLPCIKAFDAATNPGLIDITELANEVATHKHVTETYNDGTNWYRKWSDGWLEQGGILAAENRSITLIFLLPFLDNKYSISKNSGSNLGAAASDAGVSFYSLTQTSAVTVQTTNYLSSRWYACGQGAQS